MSDYYILEGHEAVPTDADTWSRWFGKADRVVAKTEIGESRVSTVFLGLDHGYGDGPVQIFETLVFGGPLADEMVRYSTWEQAMAGHEAMVERVKAAPPPGSATGE